MGQQQLLLIVLGVILVGVAVVLGIQYFGVGAEEGAKDELVAHAYDNWCKCSTMV